MGAIIVRRSAHLLRAAPGSKFAECAVVREIAPFARPDDRRTTSRAANRVGRHSANRRKSPNGAPPAAH
ncbi:MAG: hypothetical protein C0483_21260 [Pirellula sp.]|nr:hypothetical protein [Pirellula sp.]